MKRWNSYYFGYKSASFQNTRVEGWSAFGAATVLAEPYLAPGNKQDDYKGRAIITPIPICIYCYLLSNKPNTFLYQQSTFFIKMFSRAVTVITLALYASQVSALPIKVCWLRHSVFYDAYFLLA